MGTSACQPDQAVPSSRPSTRLARVADLNPAYLIWGNDEVKLDAWRSRLRRRVQQEGSDATLEVLRDDRLSGEAFVDATASLTLSMGRRYVLADGVEGWKEAEAKQAAAALKALPPQTVVVMIGGGKPPAASLVKAVRAAGGEVIECQPPAPAQYRRWIVEQGAELGVEITREAAQALLEQVGRDEQRKVRQQTLLRELEKLAVFAGPGGRVDIDAVEALTAIGLDNRVYELADALVDGNAERTMRIAEELRGKGEDIMHILYALLRQLRNTHRVAAMTAAGRPLKDVQSELRVPPWLAKKMVAQARRADPERLERALELLADLDYDVRGAGNLDADTALTLVLARAAGSADAAAAA
jgi:DNA polymerase-3 subunit delta